MMRMAVVTGSVSRLAGGTFSSIKRPMQEMARQFGTDIRVFGVEDRFSGADIPSWSPLEPVVFRAFGPRAFGWSPGMTRAVVETRPDIVQVHGIWMHYSVVSLGVRRRLGTPYVVHLHGMLDPWAVRNASLKKRAAEWLYEGRHLRGAGCLRALCEAEVRAVREFGYRGSVCQIPNGIDLPATRTPGPPPWEGRVERGKKVLLFLSRVHEKKNLRGLLVAWAGLQKRRETTAREWELVIAGWDTTHHQPELERLAVELGVEESVRFVGPLFNEDKANALANATAFVLPSFSEGLPMTILEAWAYSLPVVMTPECNLPEGFSSGAALRVDSDARSIEAGLEALMRMDAPARAAMGCQGRRLVEERFRWDVIARQMHEVNAWLVGRGAPPPSIV